MCCGVMTLNSGVFYTRRAPKADLRCCFCSSDIGGVWQIMSLP